MDPCSLLRRMERPPARALRSFSGGGASSLMPCRQVSSGSLLRATSLLALGSSLCAILWAVDGSPTAVPRLRLSLQHTGEWQLAFASD